VNKVPDLDITKLHFLGSIDYAQHNFARLKPVLYSETGRQWDGAAERAWFPNEGLVFNVQRDLHYAPNGSFWTFRVTPNSRDGAADKDLFSAIQAKPAIELLTTLEPQDSEELRYLVTELGLSSRPATKGGVAVPEIGEHWVIVPELVKGDDGRWRSITGQALKRLSVLTGAPEDLCGMATATEQFFLPPIRSWANQTRNWTSPQIFLEGLASDLRRWVPHGPGRPRAQAAAQALRELAPFISGTSALNAEDAKAALARVNALTEAADTLTESVEEIVGVLVKHESFKQEIDRQREAIRVELETEALRAVEEIEGAARDHLLQEQRRIQDEIDIAQYRLEELKAQISGLQAEAEERAIRRDRDIEALGREIDALLQRAADEPARLLTEWLGVSGLIIAGSSSSPPVANEAPSGLADTPLEKGSSDTNGAPVISPEQLGPTLFHASPGVNDGPPWLLIIDAALRARELPLLVGQGARDYAETWLNSVGGADPAVILTDPTLLSLSELTPFGSRGAHAPLAEAFARAERAGERPVVVLLDDLDPAAAAYWLPELARCQRQPARYGFPSNLLFLALLEANSKQMALTPARAGELFPLYLEGCASPDSVGALPEVTYELPPDLIVPPARSTSWPHRIAAFERSLSVTFKAEKPRLLASGLASYLQYTKNSGQRPSGADGLAAQLIRAADLIIQDNPGS